MKRDFLEKLGLEKDSIESIMAEHGKSVEVQKQKVSDLTSEVGTLKTNLTEKETAAKTFEQKLKEYEQKDLTEVDKLKKQLEEKDKTTSGLEDQLNAFKDQTKKDKINNAFKAAAKEAKIKYADDAIKLIDMSAFTLGEDGKVEGLEAAVKKLAEEKPFLLSDEDHEIGKSSNQGSKDHTKTVTKEKFQTMSYNERIQLYEKNPGLYKQLNTK
jgi:hypothetical protein